MVTCWYSGLLVSLLFQSVRCFQRHASFNRISTSACSLHVSSDSLDSVLTNSQPGLDQENHSYATYMKELFKRGQQIEVTVQQFGPLGASVYINNGSVEAKGLILQSEINYFRERRYVNTENDGDVLIGEILPAFVERVRDDGKIDVALRPVGVTRIEVVGDMIMDALEGSPSGTIPIGDKSSPGDISAYIHGISKKDFKNAIGTLYRSGKVLPGKLETALIPEEERTTENFEKNRISKKNASSRASEVEKDNEDSDARNTEEGIVSTSSATGKGRRLASLLHGPKTFRNRDESKTIFVGNLPFTINEKILENTVKKIMGPEKVASIRLVYDKETQKPKGFGYVEFFHDEDLTVALQKLKGVEVMGRNMRVDYSQPSSSGHVPRNTPEGYDSKSFRPGVSITNDRSISSPSENKMSWFNEVDDSYDSDDEFEMDELDAYFEDLDENNFGNSGGTAHEENWGKPPLKGGSMRSFGEKLVNEKEQRTRPHGNDQYQPAWRRSEGPPKFKNGQRPEATLFVGNLPYAVDEKLLKTEFERILGSGTVAATRIATEKGTNRKRGFGYVDLWDREAAHKAIAEMHGRYSILGRTINVDDATR